MASTLLTATSTVGMVIERMAYEPFGKRRFTSGQADPAGTIDATSTSRGFTGHEHLDSLDFIHMNARVYDPDIGRFLSPDPTVAHAHNPQGFNRYAYVMNNPLNFYDPDGFDSRANDGVNDYNGPAAKSDTAADGGTNGTPAAGNPTSANNPLSSKNNGLGFRGTTGPEMDSIQAATDKYQSCRGGACIGPNYAAMKGLYEGLRREGVAMQDHAMRQLDANVAQAGARLGNYEAAYNATGAVGIASLGAIKGPASKPATPSLTTNPVKAPDFDTARKASFEKAGLTDPNKVEFSKMDPKTGTVTEFKGLGGAKVGYDGPHPNTPGPHHDTQHISWQGDGKRGAGGAQRGNEPYSGDRHPSRPDRK